MSRDAVTGFLDKVADNPQLRRKVAKAVAGKEGHADNEMVELAREHGFHFTAAELRRVLAESNTQGDMSEKELEAVAGGSVAPMIRKLTRNTDP